MCILSLIHRHDLLIILLLQILFFEKFFCLKQKSLKCFLLVFFTHIFQVTSTDFWKVPFEDALDLVRKRRVLLIFGYAFVSEDDLQVILCTRLRLNIAASMAVSIYCM